MSVERIAKWPLFIYHKLNERTRMHLNNASYSLLARINPSNSMIMQAVSYSLSSIPKCPYPIFFCSFAYRMNYQYYYLLL